MGMFDAIRLFTPEAFQTLLTPAGTTATFDFSLGRLHQIDLVSASGDVTLTLDNPVVGAVYGIKVLQGATARDLIWPGTVLWAGGAPPAISAVDNDLDFIQLLYDGTNYLGLFNLAFA